MSCNRTCQWCGRILVLSDKAKKYLMCFCDESCADAEKLFTLHYSDEEIHRREHYLELTGGEDEDTKKLPP